MQNSIWTNDSALPVFPKLEEDIKTDVAIIGGGLAGILCAWQLKQAGIDYVLIEADRICHGVTRNTTAKITSQHGLIYGQLLRRFGAEAARLYFDANQDALTQYQALAQRIDCDFEQKDHYIYATDDATALEEELAALARIHAPAQFVPTPELPFPTLGAIRFSQQAQFHPLKFVSGIAKELRIYENTAAKEFKGNTIITDSGRITASKIIVATHFPLINKHGSYFLKLYQQRSYVLALDHCPNVKGMYLGSDKECLSFRNHNGLLLLGGGGHRTGKKGSGWRKLEEFAQTYYPGSRQVCRWAAQDCMSLDTVPYIGPYSANTPDLFVATGFNKWGTTSSMAAATVLADLVQGKENPYAAVFSPQRNMLRPQLLKNGAETLCNLLRPTVPRCPHMGCALKWNPQERSWDCSCHGSRFTEHGKLLDNPATSDLKNSRSQ